MSAKSARDKLHFLNIGIDKELIKQARVQAAMEGKTLTGLIREGLAKIVKSDLRSEFKPIIGTTTMRSGPTIARMKPDIKAS